jgi:hypothetical protein
MVVHKVMKMTRSGGSHGKDAMSVSMNGKLSNEFTKILNQHARSRFAQTATVGKKAMELEASVLFIENNATRTLLERLASSPKRIKYAHETN